jgi:hypothetical protein
MRKRLKCILTTWTSTYQPQDCFLHWSTHCKNFVSVLVPTEMMIQRNRQWNHPWHACCWAKG